MDQSTNNNEQSKFDQFKAQAQPHMDKAQQVGTDLAAAAKDEIKRNPIAIALLTILTLGN
jgi:hypothetical protein